MQLSNWGNYPTADVRFSHMETDYRCLAEKPVIPRGMGRCYGDASLGEHVMSMLKLNRFLAFDAVTGIVCCEAGLTFEELIEVCLPKGWFPPVTPGTKYVSLGGALAANVHGKNHHCEGAISRYVLDFELLLAGGETILCSREQHPDIFWATLGGMGLTGFILRLSLQLKQVETNRISAHILKARDLNEILEMLDAFEQDTYSVAWLDCLASGKKMGRSILSKGEHMSLAELSAHSTPRHPLAAARPSRLNVPFFVPSFVLNPLSIRLFNVAYYHKQIRKHRHSSLSYEPFFYPLDAIQHWNRIYGRRGFVQYQFVIPKAAGAKGLKRILQYIQQHGKPSFLTVLKLLGAGEGLMAFPMEGYTLAMDFAVQKGLFPFLDELDHMVADYGGRVYLAKDARLAPEMLRRMYPQLEAFQAVLAQVDPHNSIASLLSERLNIKG